MTRHDDGIDLGRRHAMQTGGLAIAFLWLGGVGTARAMIDARRQPGDAAAALADGNPPFAPNAFIRIDAHGAIRLVMPSVEMGQGVYTGASMLLAEELGVGLDQINVEHAPPSDELYGMPLLGGQITGGSTSTRGSWQVLREAGAVARTMLVTAAAAQWHVDPAACTVERGVIHHAASGRSVAFGAVAVAAGKLPMPDKVQLTDPKDFKLLGKPMRRVDSPDKVKGATQFGIDVRLTGMKIATVMACPTLAGKLASVDDKAARAVPGVVTVLRLDNAVAVVGDHFWAAKQGLQALNITWDHGPNATLTTQQLRDALAESARHGQSIVAVDTGSRPAQGTTVHSEYRSPMLAHATMEPMNATVSVTADKCEVWTGTQVPMRALQAAAKITGLAEDKVVLHNQYLGGGFGRRLETDWVEQAVALAKQVSYPLKVVWTREEDIRHDRVRPMYHDVVSAVLDANGMPAWFGYRTSGSSVLARFAPPAMGKDGMDSDAVECVAQMPYDIPAKKVEWIRHDMPIGLVTGWWRGVGPTHNLFVVESFVDEMAHRAGKDPLEYRRALLQKNPRTLAVLNLAAEKIGWGKTLPSRVGRGIALGEPFGSRICAMVEAEVTPQGEVHLRRVVAALDCGMIVNSSSIEAQIQGGLLFGLSAAMFNAITIKDGGIEQGNFNDYRSLRINEAPSVEFYRVVNAEPPGGLGEVGTAIAAPALANAIFAATGVRLYELPVDRRLLVQSPDALKSVVSASRPERRDAT
ncbi:xanthine dehydrogenase family protein molybdopterin-binding subunit [Dyella mobilis]|uniref:Xanthine dehydrogenase family protein molybdopterin-binding subunit n=1 Tax=Dyella mobilis TaxID=1849582 RepID=A0ABS2KC60_9GAMM|nr:molybdopterin cofactor-binding domain-containing protein [Dyella mobilis]MBM7128775.1 xanthine dehydrogenase family protein molybdopterin-binding subunit [Dyella mobilis]GLQ99106.1 aldehyde dehydrogenase [Dyella mobilis]